MDRQYQRGDTIGNWTILGLLGKGGMGVVYDVVHRVTDRPGALKILTKRGKNAEVWAAKMLDEARMLGRLRHANLVDIYDAGDGQDGIYWIVMEKLVGRDLGDVLKEEGALGLQRALGYAEAIASACVAAHAAGVVHRDIKPDNIHISETEAVKVIDFGASRFKEGRTIKGVIGTIPYMSPEQLRAPKTLDARSDVWSLAIVLHEMLAGRQLFRIAGREWLPREQVIHTILAPTELSAFDDIDARIRPILKRATAKNRLRRLLAGGSVAAFSVGGAMAITGMIILLTDSAPSGIEAAPVVAPGEVGGHLRVRF